MSLTIRPMQEADLDAADKAQRLAFGTFFGLPDPLAFGGTSCRLELRSRRWRDGALVAEQDGELVGVAISSRWGSLGIFGPLAVHPAHWRSGIGRRMLEATMPIYERWQCRAVGLFTHPQSVSHVALYQRFGFWPRSLTAIMSRAVTPSPVPQAPALRALAIGEQRDAIAQCAVLSDALFPGLDLRDEIATVLAHPTADTIVLTEGSTIAGFAICHVGPRSEADSGIAYVKFAAARPGVNAARDFQRLIAATSDFAYQHGADKLSAGINMGCFEAYRLMLGAGFRTVMHGVAMHRPWIEIYDRPDVFALEDWR